MADEQVNKLELKGSEKILDIGCGDRKVTAGITILVPQDYATGIYSSREMDDFAKNAFVTHKPPDLAK